MDIGVTGILLCGKVCYTAACALVQTAVILELILELGATVSPIDQHNIATNIVYVVTITVPGVRTWPKQWDNVIVKCKKFADKRQLNFSKITQPLMSTLYISQLTVYPVLATTSIVSVIKDSCYRARSLRGYVYVDWTNKVLCYLETQAWCGETAHKLDHRGRRPR